MALTGNIEIFPLPEVLRLLARSGKNGCLRVDAGGVDGRIYLDQGAVSLATVATDTELIDQFTSSGLIDPDRLRGHDTISLPEALVTGHGPEELGDLVREHVVEALYRIRKPGRGMFEFLVDADSRFRTGQRLDAEQLVGDADRRASDWADIEQTISDTQLPVRMVRELPEPEVTVNAPTWRVLSALEGGASISEIARHLGTTQFRAAREIASLIRASLVEAVPVTVPTWEEPAPAPSPAPSPAPAPAYESTPSAGTPEGWFSPPAPETPELADETPAPSPWAATTPSPAPAVDDPWHTENWDRGPAEETVEETPPTPEEPAQPADTRSGGWWAEAMGAADEVGAVDTDEFLESVFSEAEGEGEAEEESGFSMGLLRRRRMGPVTKDITEGR